MTCLSFEVVYCARAYPFLGHGRFVQHGRLGYDCTKSIWRNSATAVLRVNLTTFLLRSDLLITLG